MIKKFVLTTALIAVSGALVWGAVIRTQAKAGIEGASQNSAGRGRVEVSTVSASLAGDVSAQAQDGAVERWGGDGRGQPGGDSADGNAGGGYAAGNGGLYNLPPASGELSAAESAALLYMREEEKLAHDVYLALYEKWRLPVFNNISQSEQTHTEAVLALLERYGVDDPASSQVGVFTNPELQALYTKLVARGSQSLAEALKVGGAIEEIDILDLRSRLVQTDNADIQQVFANLERGSYNHLRAFASTLLTQSGETYQPQHLSAEAYAEIMAGTTGGGNGRGGQGSGYRGGQP